MAFTVNEYFDGKVKSLAFATPEGPATIGVIEKGEYEFGTSDTEYMTVVSGSMEALLPGTEEWKAFGEFETFTVPKNSKFKVRVKAHTAYRCLYR